MHASCESPWHSLAKHCILDTCFLLTAPFRGMLLTPQGGPRCLAPTAHQIPVYLMVFSTFLCRAFTAQYLYTPRYCYISPLCFTAQRRLEVHIWTRPRCQGGFKLKQHASGQMQPYIRPLGEDILWSSGPDAICASSPDHDRGLTGPGPDQG